MAQSMTPMEDALRAKGSRDLGLASATPASPDHIGEALKPGTFEIYNDSHKHSHHKAMQGVTSRETHFRLIITSSAFQGKPQLARHRMVNSLMKDEIAQEGGIHALQLTTRTPEEEEARKQKGVAA
ncbi:bola-like protein-domain-containing protein [Boeremia exigua]|uniref:bola-like protein-domain-containing protein n=1 Tax=Boeremia exigua TaxID=749465 RepID=UPI001E8D1992|nr:bola-like protein-domain-containing protein [Boeremia exigua]KAH6620242.1 bola-like protein-domain-containing protein [Boeremia exigua]